MATKFRSSTFHSSSERVSDRSTAVKQARERVGSLMNSVVNDARAAGMSRQHAIDGITDRALKRSVTERSGD